MTQEEKHLLLTDLCARLPYGVLCSIGLDYPLPLQRLYIGKLDGILFDFYEDGEDYQVYLSEVKPYLRPMSSMTEEEKEEFISFNGTDGCYIKTMDFCHKHHLDNRGLIPMGLALEAPDDMYKTE